jgi:lysophospholipase L1-like esterase
MALPAVFRALAAPVWLAQGLHVALTTPRLPEAEGPRAGRVGAGRLGLMIIGDSSAAGVGVAAQDQALAGRLVAALADLEPDWRLVARTGATTAATLARLRALPDPAPAEVAVLALGVNDLTRAVPMARWLDQQRDLADLLTSRFGVRRLYLSGVPPMGMFPALPRPLRGVLGARASRFDAALAGLAAAIPGARHLAFDAAQLHPDMMAADGFHPGAAAYALWAGALARAIRADLAPCEAAANLPPGPRPPGGPP